MLAVHGCTCVYIYVCTVYMQMDRTTHLFLQSTDTLSLSVCLPRVRDVSSRFTALRAKHEKKKNATTEQFNQNHDCPPERASNTSRGGGRPRLIQQHAYTRRPMHTPVSGTRETAQTPLHSFGPRPPRDRLRGDGTRQFGSKK